MKPLKTNINGLKDVMPELRPGHYYGLFGPPDSGKSLLAYQIAVQYKSLIICTEDMDYDAFDFLKNRYQTFQKPEIVRARSFNKFLREIGINARFGTSETKFEIMLTPEENRPLLSKDYELLVVDSLTSPIKNYLPAGRQNREARSAALSAIFGALDEVIDEKWIPVIVILHESRDPANRYDTGRPWGGNVVLHAIKHLFQMQRTGGVDSQKKKEFIKQIRRRRFVGKPEEQDWTNLVIKKDYGYV